MDSPFRRLWVDVSTAPPSMLRTSTDDTRANPDRTEASQAFRSYSRVSIGCNLGKSIVEIRIVAKTLTELDHEMPVAFLLIRR